MPLTPEQLKSVHIQPLPDRPERMRYYDSCDEKGQRGLDKAGFWREDEVVAYVNAKWKAIQHNLNVNTNLRQTIYDAQQAGDHVLATVAGGKMGELMEWASANWGEVKGYFK